MYDLFVGLPVLTNASAQLATTVDPFIPEGYESWVGRLKMAAFLLTCTGGAITAIQYLKGVDIRRVAMSAASVAMLLVTSIVLSFLTA